MTGRLKGLRRLLWVLAVGFLLIFGLRSLVGDVHPVASTSMEPALHPGEQVFVRYGLSGLERFDMVVVTNPSAGTIVKRLVGLPGESVRVTAAGDLHINGKPLDRGSPRPEAIPIFDGALHPLDGSFLHGGTQVDPWTQVGDGWELDGRELPAGSSAGLLRYRKNIHDDRIGEDGQVIWGQESVRDLILECEVMPLASGGVLRFELGEGLETYQARLDLTSLDSVGVEIRRWVKQPEILTTGQVGLPQDRWTTVRFANVDDCLTLEVGGTEVGFTGSPTSLAARPAVGERVRLGGEQCLARFRGIRILRDQHYTLRGHYGVSRQLTLGPGEIYVLGDNSANSLDSRELGPIPLGRVVGVATLVVWPWDRIRRR